MNLAHWIDHWAEMEPGRIALRFQGTDATYAELAGRIDRLAGSLVRELHLERGDRIAFLCHNDPAIVELLFAAARAGLIVVPLNWRLAPPELEYILADCTPGALLVGPEFRDTTERVARAAGRPARIALDGGAGAGWIDLASLRAAGSPRASGGRIDDDFEIVYTSGTTGRPKGAVLTQNAIFHTAVNGTAAYDLTSADRILNALPMFHVGGLHIQSLPALHAGATLVLQRSFEPGECLRLLVEERITRFIAVPTMLLALMARPEWSTADLSRLRGLTTGSTSVPEALLEAVIARGIPVDQMYGTTETAPTAILTRASLAPAALRSCGHPVLHGEAMIADEQGRELPHGEAGEILVRGPHVMRGYWKNARATAEAFHDGWFRTGDIGHRDADGAFYVDDRKKDVIISGGENIYSAELEAVLAGCPGLLESAVVARPDATWGEVPVVVAVRRAPEAIDEAQVLALFDGRLARYKRPRAVRFVDALPRNAMGKVLKHALRDGLRDG